MSHPHRLWNMYITAAISVALVLCLVGMECVLLLSAGTLMHHMKENMSFTAVLTEDADSASCARFEAMLSAADYCSDYRYISSEEALQEHIESLGEDPAAFLGYNPLAASYEIHPSAEYAHPDSMAVLEARLTALPYIDQVIYQRDLAKLMNRTDSGGIGVTNHCHCTYYQHNPPANLFQAFSYQHDDPCGCHSVGDQVAFCVALSTYRYNRLIVGYGSSRRYSLLCQYPFGDTAFCTHVAEYRFRGRCYPSLGCTHHARLIAHRYGALRTHEH